jgi:hypothetical protein
METINGATVIWPEPGGAAAEAARGPAVLGPEQGNAAYVAWVGAMAAAMEAALSRPPDTDEGFYVADGELTSSSATGRWSRPPARSSSCRAASRTRPAIPAPGRCGASSCCPPVTPSTRLSGRRP